MKEKTRQRGILVLIYLALMFGMTAGTLDHGSVPLMVVGYAGATVGLVLMLYSTTRHKRPLQYQRDVARGRAEYQKERRQ